MGNDGGKPPGGQITKTTNQKNARNVANKNINNWTFKPISVFVSRQIRILRNKSVLNVGLNVIIDVFLTDWRSGGRPGEQ